MITLVMVSIVILGAFFDWIWQEIKTFSLREIGKDLFGFFFKEVK